MVEALFSRKVPFYLLPIGTHSDLTFDAIKVKVPAEVLEYSVMMRLIIEEMEETFANNPSYEEAVDGECDKWVRLIREEIGYGYE